MAVDTPVPVYRRLLHQAHAWGRADGSFAVDFEPDRPTEAGGTGWCRGLGPEEFARRLWAERPGSPPAGLALCAPHWYSTGFAEGLAAGQSNSARRPAARVAPSVSTGR